MFKIDTHVHTKEISPCGNIAAEETVKLYKEAGFDGLIITDHYRKDIFKNMPRYLSWNKKVDFFSKGYKNALEAGIKYGLTILLGIEIKFHGIPEDYLVYGIDIEFLKKNPQLYNYNANDFSKFARENKLLFIQAHPFRRYLSCQPSSILDGVEVYNGNPRHNSYNVVAQAFAKDNNLLMTSGSDCHEYEDVGRGGMIFEKKIRTIDDFIKQLKGEQFRLIEE